MSFFILESIKVIYFYYIMVKLIFKCIYYILD